MRNATLLALVLAAMSLGFLAGCSGDKSEPVQPKAAPAPGKRPTALEPQ